MSARFFTNALPEAAGQALDALAQWGIKKVPSTADESEQLRQMRFAHIGKHLQVRDGAASERARNACDTLGREVKPLWPAARSTGRGSSVSGVAENPLCRQNPARHRRLMSAVGMSGKTGPWLANERKNARQVHGSGLRRPNQPFGAGGGSFSRSVTPGWVHQCADRGKPVA